MSTKTSPYFVQPKPEPVRCEMCIRYHMTPLETRILLKQGASIQPLCDRHAKLEMFDLIIDNRQITFSTLYNSPAPIVVEVIDNHPVIVSDLSPISG